MRRDNVEVAVVALASTAFAAARILARVFAGGEEEDGPSTTVDDPDPGWLGAPPIENFPRNKYVREFHIGARVIAGSPDDVGEGDIIATYPLDRTMAKEYLEARFDGMMSRLPSEQVEQAQIWKGMLAVLLDGAESPEAFIENVDPILTDLHSAMTGNLGDPSALIARLAALENSFVVSTTTTFVQ